MGGLEHEFNSLWWPWYPRKQGKLDALKAYIQARKNASVEELVEGVKRYLEHLPHDQQFIKLPASWIRAGCWMDEYDAPQSAQPHVEGRKDCQHEPRCPSNDWHAVLLRREQERAGAA